MLIIFDKDQTLVDGLEGRPPNTLEEQRPRRGVVARCEQLRAEGHTLAIASNQGGVAWGFMRQAEAEALVAAAADLIGAVAWRMCPHHPQGRVAGYAIDCECRKPKAGMLLSLATELGVAPADCLYVGDADSDEAAAAAAGMRFERAREFFDGW